MNYHITRNDSFSLGAVARKTANVAAAYITVDVHHENSTLDQALYELYGDLLLSGNSKKDRSQFLNAVNLLGASIGVSISDGKCTITLKSTAETFSKVLTLTEEMLATPTFTSKEITRVADNAVSALQILKEDTNAGAKHLVRNALYDKRDRRAFASETELIKTIPTIGKTELDTMHARVMHAYWTCTIAADDTNTAAFGKLLTKLKKGHETTAAQGFHKQIVPKRKLYLTDVPSKSNVDYSIGAHVPITLHHPDYVAVRFAANVLGIRGFAGRLMSTVRDKEGLTYDIYAVPETFTSDEQGMLRIFSFFTPENSAQGITSTFREVKKFFKKGVGQAEYEKFKEITVTKQTLLQDSLMGQLNDLHAFNAEGFTVEEISSFKEKVQLLKRAEINAVIKKYFNPKNFVVCGAGPTKKIHKELEKLTKQLIQ